MDEDILNEFINRFFEIKKMGWVESHRYNDTGIGKTFEDLMGITENNKRKPDFENIEIKTQRFDSNSDVTLFSLNPTHGKNRDIYNTYGVVGDTGYKEFHTTLKSNKFNTYKNDKGFKLEIKSNANRIDIIYKDFNSGAEKRIADYSFKNLKKNFNKINVLAFIKAKSKKEQGHEYFKYDELILYTNTSFDIFLNLAESKIVFEFRLGVYKSGKRKGKYHDHGNAFRCNERYLSELYNKRQVLGN